MQRSVPEIDNILDSRENFLKNIHMNIDNLSSDFYKDKYIGPKVSLLESKLKSDFKKIEKWVSISFDSDDSNVEYEIDRLINRVDNHKRYINDSIIQYITIYFVNALLLN
uniref:Uncharacterized protein n=1 Tax=viral metagenome TaxID=1070528 RepID=A0A6C0CC52_9ZZZZ